MVANHLQYFQIVAAFSLLGCCVAAHMQGRHNNDAVRRATVVSGLT